MVQPVIIVIGVSHGIRRAVAELQKNGAVVFGGFAAQVKLQ